MSRHLDVGYEEQYGKDHQNEAGDIHGNGPQREEGNGYAYDAYNSRQYRARTAQLEDDGQRSHAQQNKNQVWIDEDLQDILRPVHVDIIDCDSRGVEGDGPVCRLSGVAVGILEELAEIWRDEVDYMFGQRLIVRNGSSGLYGFHRELNVVSVVAGLGPYIGLGEIRHLLPLRGRECRSTASHRAGGADRRTGSHGGDVGCHCHKRSGRTRPGALRIYKHHRRHGTGIHVLNHVLRASRDRRRECQAR